MFLKVIVFVFTVNGNKINLKEKKMGIAIEKIIVADWKGYEDTRIGIKHLTEFDYSKEKRNESIDKILNAGLNLMVQQSKNNIIIWITDGRFTQS